MPEARSLDGRGRGAALGDWGTWIRVRPGSFIRPDPGRAPRKGPREGGVSGPRSRLTRGPRAWVKGALEGHGVRPDSDDPVPVATPRKPTNPKEGPATEGATSPRFGTRLGAEAVRVGRTSGPGAALGRPGLVRLGTPVHGSARGAAVPHEGPCAGLGSRPGTGRAECRLGSEWRALTRVRGRAGDVGNLGFGPQPGPTPPRRLAPGA